MNEKSPQPLTMEPLSQAETFDSAHSTRNDLGRFALEKLPHRTDPHGKIWVSIPILPEVVRRRPKD